LDNRITNANIRTDGINYKVCFCVYIYIYSYLSALSQSIRRSSNETFHASFFLSQRLFDHKIGNMTDENDGEKKKECVRGECLF
jgi:Gpi18-like mannosyltransferase